MPQFGLRGATVAQYNNNNGAITYSSPISAGCAISANLELQFAEARLYACDSLAEYLRECIGETSVNLMYGIKKVFDPNLILNPGKVCYPLE